MIDGFENVTGAPLSHVKSFLSYTFDANYVTRYSGVGMSAYDTVRKSIQTLGASNQLLGLFLGCSRIRLGAADIASWSRMSEPDW